jgi:hypothetical protein
MPESIQPPTLADEQRCTAAPLQLNENDNCGRAFSLMPRSTHINVQPRTHSMVVGPAGAFTTSSKSGARI